MDRARFRVALLACLCLAACNPTLPAFPGAEGFGTTTPGGRGGRVLFVTNLDDSGPGSLRDALAYPAPRIVVFRVGGTITLQSPLEITAPYLTVAGQSAPGGGIQLRNDPVAPYGLTADSFQSIRIDTHDVVLRYLRVRPGPLDANPACTGPNALAHPDGYPTCVDAYDIRAIHLLPAAHHVVLDHLSLAWSSDELVAVQGATDFTVQWSILAEGMDSVLYEGFFAAATEAHGHGIIVGDRTTAASGEPTLRYSLHHNLFAHNTDRNPQVSAECAGTLPELLCAADIVNNVTYNWRRGGINVHNALGHTFASIEHNFLRAGPDTEAPLHTLALSDWTSSAYSVVPNATLQVSALDNRLQVGATLTDAPIECSRWNPVGHWELCDPATYASPQMLAPAVTHTSAEQALDEVLATAGASARRSGSSSSWRANRDATDLRVVAEVRDGTGRIIDSQAEFPGWPTLLSGPVSTDSDDDGMPSAWERTQCLDPTLPNDAADDDGDVYTNVEEYLNGTAATDRDRDGVLDHRDNCSLVSNAGQRDDDATPDGLGDACDCDFDGNASCDAADASSFAACIATPLFPDCDAEDMNDDGALDSRDATLHDAARADALPGPGAPACPF